MSLAQFKIPIWVCNGCGMWFTSAIIAKALLNDVRWYEDLESYIERGLLEK